MSIGCFCFVDIGVPGEAGRGLVTLSFPESVSDLNTEARYLGAKASAAEQVSVKQVQPLLSGKVASKLFGKKTRKNKEVFSLSKF